MRSQQWLNTGWFHSFWWSPNNRKHKQIRDRLIKEAINIRIHTNNFNRDKDLQLSETCDPFLSKLTNCEERWRGPMTSESTVQGYDLIPLETRPGDSSQHDVGKLRPTNEVRGARWVVASQPTLSTAATVSRPTDNMSISATMRSILRVTRLRSTITRRSHIGMDCDLSALGPIARSRENYLKALSCLPGRHPWRRPRRSDGWNLGVRLT